MQYNEIPNNDNSRRFSVSLTAVSLKAVILLFFLFTLLLTGCTTRYTKGIAEVRNVYFGGNTELALEKISQLEDKVRKRDLDVLLLNSAIIELSNGSPKKAEDHLRIVRNHFDDLEEAALKKATENSFSLWTDDNAISYPGEDYEKVLIRSFLAIANLLQDGGDAQAYAGQITAKQDEIVYRGGTLDPDRQDNPKRVYKRIALGPYLQGLQWEATWINQDDAAAAYRKAVDWEPYFRHGAEALTRAEKSVHSGKNNGVIHVFALVGQGPRKREDRAIASSAALLVADRIFSMTSKYSVPPTLAPIPIPEIYCVEPEVHSVGLSIDGQPVSSTETILDINRLATEQYEVVRDYILAKAIVRRVIKKGTVYAMKEVGDVDGWGSILMDIAGVVWEATESADLRCWELLPAKIQVARLELPAGEHEIAFQPCYSNRKPLGLMTRTKIKVSPNRNSYVLVNYPDSNLLGSIVVNDDSLPTK